MSVWVCGGNQRGSSMGAVPDLLVAHRGVGELKLLNARAMLVVDHHGTVLGIHVHAVDAPAKRPTGILDLKLIKGELQIARGEGRERLGLVGKHALQLRQDLGHLALLHRGERHQRALGTALAGVLGQGLGKDLAQQLLCTRQIHRASRAPCPPGADGHADAPARRGQSCPSPCCQSPRR